MINTYPLSWPIGWKRNPHPETSRFSPGSPYEETIKVYRELELLGATNIVISSNMQYRADGLPYARQNVQDTGVAVYFTLKGEQRCIPCDRWVSLSENIRAIWKTIEALRGIDRWGAKEMVDASFSGFKALPEGSKDWWSILGVSKDASPEVIELAYKRLRKVHHPDMGGDADKFKEVVEAYKDATS